LNLPHVISNINNRMQQTTISEVMAYGLNWLSECKE
jgi:hypothetical protein